MAKDSARTARRRELIRTHAPTEQQKRKGQLTPKPQRPKRLRDQQPTQGAQSITPQTPQPRQPVTFTPAAQALVAQFAASQPFPLDPFQVESAAHLAEGRSVLVAAPTGTGKTVVAEFGIWLARRDGLRAIYTAPLKALSNQKFRDLRQRYGEREVGLLTGDIVENPRAPIVVMTTEIYRNMLLEGLRVATMPPAPEISPTEEAERLLAGITRRTAKVLAADSLSAEGSEQVIAADDVAELARRSALDEELSTVGCVIFDELHYLADPGRGPVWEEAIIHSPKRVTLIGLSATVSNADELRRWMEHVHGPTSLVFHTERSVPLEHYFFLDGQLHLVQNAAGERVERFPNIGGEAKLARMRGRFRRYTTYSDDEDDENRERNTGAPATTTERPSRAVRRAERERAISEQLARRDAGNGSTTNEASTQSTPPELPKERAAPEAGETLTALRDAELLPCIYFLPGRRAVEVAAESAKGHLLVTPEERARLQAEVQAWVERLPVEDQKLEQVQRLAALLPRGLAFHHAGLLPGLKVMVETLFQRGDLRAVFATDTLALGVNMPARSVVLGSLSKFDGVQMRLMTPNEYQQLTGRAGRRGMDAKGAAIIPYSQWDAFEPAFAALTAPLLPVTSAFTIRYNTVLNLWRANDPERLRIALAASLREFQRRGGPGRASHQVEQTEVEYDIEAPQSAARKRARQHRNPYTLSRAAAAELDGTIAVLRGLRYIDEDDELSVKGRLLRALFHPAGVILTELLVGGALDGLTAPELAEAVSWFTYDDDRSLRNSDYLSQRLVQLRREIATVRKRVVSREYEEGLALSPGIMDAFHGVALNWHRGFSLNGLLRRIDLAEGDLLVTLNQTIDLLQQLQGAVGQALDAQELWQEASEDTRTGRNLIENRARLTRLRPLLDGAWRGMLRGSVAQSRAIPSMSTPTIAPATDVAPHVVADLPAALANEDLPPLSMAEDEEPDTVRQDSVEEA